MEGWVEQKNIIFCSFKGVSRKTCRCQTRSPYFRSRKYCGANAAASVTLKRPPESVAPPIGVHTPDVALLVPSRLKPTSVDCHETLTLVPVLTIFNNGKANALNPLLVSNAKSFSSPKSSAP